MFKKSKQPTHEEVMSVVSQYITGEIEKYDKSVQQIQENKNKVLSEIKKITGSVEEKNRLFAEQAKQIEQELYELNRQQNKLADSLVFADTPEEAAAVEVELGEISAKRSVMETKLKAFANSRVGLLKASERQELAKKIQEYDDLNFPLNQEIKDNFTELKTLVDRLTNNTLEFKPSSVHSGKPKKAMEIICDKYLLGLLVSEENFKLIEQNVKVKPDVPANQQRIFKAWLDEKRDIRFNDFIPSFLEAEKQQNEELERTESERIARGIRERDERNEAAMQRIHDKNKVTMRG